jgi:hypothetical protein
MKKKRTKWRLPEEPEHDSEGRRIRIRHPDEFKQKLVLKQQGFCYICGESFYPNHPKCDDSKYDKPAYWMPTYEHKVLFRCGGKDDESNITVSHRYCNEKRDHKDWIEAIDLQALRGFKQDIISERAGTDPDYDGILTELGIVDEIDTDELLSRFFDYLLNFWNGLIQSGPVEIYRAMMVDDIHMFDHQTGEMASFGRHWSWDKTSADSVYACEVHGSDEIILTAHTEEFQIDWPTSLQQNFAHPHERELSIKSHVKLIKTEHRK